MRARRRDRGRRRRSTASRSGTRSCARRSTTPPPPRAGRGCTCARARRSRPPARRPASSPTTSSPPARSAGPRPRSRTAPRRPAGPSRRTPTRRRAWHLEQALVALGPDEPLARAELLIALGDVRWQASEPGARAAFDEAAELARAPRRARGAGARGARRRRAPLHADRARHRLRRPARGGARRARRQRRAAARAAAGAARRAPRARRRRRPPGATGRRGGGDGARAPATRARSPPRCWAATPRCWTSTTSRSGSRSIDEALAVAERLEAGELVALALHWRIYDLVELGDDRGRPGTPTNGCEALAHELHQPLYSHAALAWRAVSAHLNGQLRGGRADRARVAADRRGGRRARGARVLPHAAVRGAARAGPARPSSSTRSSGCPGSPARSA